jgi:hypothetical protein
MTIEQKEYCEHYREAGNCPICAVEWFHRTVREQASIIKNQAEEIAALKQQLEDYEHGHNAEMEGMDDSPC